MATKTARRTFTLDEHKDVEAWTYAIGWTTWADSTDEGAELIGLIPKDRPPHDDAQYLLMRTGDAVTVEVCWSGELRRFGTLREALWSIRPLTSDEETAMTTYRPAWAGLLEE
jgi:hypothetical protein